MSQSKIEALKNSHRKAAVKQEILPRIEPLVKPTRDVSSDNRTVSLNLKQPLANQNFEQERQKLERELQDLQFQHQANLVYNKQFKALGKLFGNENLEFQQIRHKIQSLILNSKGGQSQYYPPASNYLQRVGSSTEYQTASQDISNYSKQQLKDKLIAAGRSQFLSILQLGSGIVFENQSYENRKRKGVRQMFYQIWRDVLTSSQQVASKLHKLELKSDDRYGSNSIFGNNEQKSSSYQKQMIQKNKHITELAEQLERVNEQVSQKQRKINMYKDNYELIEKQCESVTNQSKNLIEQIQKLKRKIIELEDKVHEYEDKQYYDNQRQRDNIQQLQFVKAELREVKERQERKCNQMITTIDQLMANVQKYDTTIADLESQKNQTLRQMWLEKAQNQQLRNKFKRLQNDLAQQRQKYGNLESEMGGLKSKYRSGDEENEKRIQELNDQIISTRQQQDKKQRQSKQQMQQIIKQKDKIQTQLQQTLRELEMFKDKGNNQSEPHTAVFGAMRLSDEMGMRTSIIDQKALQIQQAVKKAQMIWLSQKQKLNSELSDYKSRIEDQQSRSKQTASYIENLKNNAVSHEITISQIKEENSSLSKQIGTLELQIGAYQQRIRQLEGYLEQQYLTISKEKDEYGDKLSKIENQYKKIMSEKKMTVSNDSVKQKEQQLKNLANKLEESVVINKDMSEKVEKYKLQVSELESRIIQFSGSQNSYKQKIADLQLRLNKELAQIQQAQSAKIGVEKQLQKVQKLIQNLQTEHSQKYTKLNNLIADRNQLINSLQQENVELNQQIQAFKKNQIRILSGKSIQVNPQSSDRLNQSLQTTSLQEIKELENYKAQYIEMSNRLNLSEENCQQLRKQNQDLHKLIEELQINYNNYIENKSSNKLALQSSIPMNSLNNPKNSLEFSELQKALEKASSYSYELEKLLQQKQVLLLNLQKQSADFQISGSSIEGDQHTKIITLQQQIQFLGNQLVSRQQAIKKKDIYISEITTTLSNQIQQMNAMTKQLSEMKGKYNPISSQNQSLKQQLQKMNNKLTETARQLQIIRLENKNIKQQADGLKQLNETLRSQNESLKEINQKLRNDNSGLTSFKNVLETQNSHLTQQINELSQKLRLSSNDKLDISAVNADSSKKIMHRYSNSNGQDIRGQLHTIKQIMNSQNSIQDENPYSNMLPGINGSIKLGHAGVIDTIVQDNQSQMRQSKYSNEIENKNASSRINLRQNQAYKTVGEVERQKNIINQQGSVSQNTGFSGYQTNSNFRTRPAIQKNSAFYEALLRQSQEMDERERRQDEIDYQSNPSKSIIDTINNNQDSQQYEESNRQLSQSPSSKRVENRYYGNNLYQSNKSSSQGQSQSPQSGKKIVTNYLSEQYVQQNRSTVPIATSSFSQHNIYSQRTTPAASQGMYTSQDIRSERNSTSSDKTLKYNESSLRKSENQTKLASEKQLSNNITSMQIIGEQLQHLQDNMIQTKKPLPQRTSEASLNKMVNVVGITNNNSNESIKSLNAGKVNINSMQVIGQQLNRMQQSMMNTIDGQGLNISQNKIPRQSNTEFNIIKSQQLINQVIASNNNSFKIVGQELQKMGNIISMKNNSSSLSALQAQSGKNLSQPNSSLKIADQKIKQQKQQPSQQQLYQQQLSQQQLSQRQRSQQQLSQQQRSQQQLSQQQRSQQQLSQQQISQQQLSQRQLSQQQYSQKELLKQGISSVSQKSSQSANQLPIRIQNINSQQRSYVQNLSASNYAISGNGSVQNHQIIYPYNLAQFYTDPYIRGSQYHVSSANAYTTTYHSDGRTSYYIRNQNQTHNSVSNRSPLLLQTKTEQALRPVSTVKVDPSLKNIVKDQLPSHPSQPSSENNSVNQIGSNSTVQIDKGQHQTAQMYPNFKEVHNQIAQNQNSPQFLQSQKSNYTTNLANRQVLEPYQSQKQVLTHLLKHQQSSRISQPAISINKISIDQHQQQQQQRQNLQQNTLQYQNRNNYDGSRRELNSSMQQYYSQNIHLDDRINGNKQDKMSALSKIIMQSGQDQNTFGFIQNGISNSVLPASQKSLPGNQISQINQQNSIQSKKNQTTIKQQSQQSVPQQLRQQSIQERSQQQTQQSVPQQLSQQSLQERSQQQTQQSVPQQLSQQSLQERSQQQTQQSVPQQLSQQSLQERSQQQTQQSVPQQLSQQSVPQQLSQQSIQERSQQQTQQSVPQQLSQQSVPQQLSQQSLQERSQQQTQQSVPQQLSQQSLQERSQQQTQQSVPQQLSQQSIQERSQQQTQQSVPQQLSQQSIQERSQQQTQQSVPQQLSQQSVPQQLSQQSIQERSQQQTQQSVPQQLSQQSIQERSQQQTQQSVPQQLSQQSIQERSQQQTQQSVPQQLSQQSVPQQLSQQSLQERSQQQTQQSVPQQLSQQSIQERSQQQTQQSVPQQLSQQSLQERSQQQTQQSVPQQLSQQSLQERSQQQTQQSVPQQLSQQSIQERSQQQSQQSTIKNIQPQIDNQQNTITKKEGLQADSKSVVSQQWNAQKVENMKSISHEENIIRQPIKPQPSSQNIQNQANRVTLNARTYNFGPNVISAQSQTTLRQISARNATQTVSPINSGRISVSLKLQQSNQSHDINQLNAQNQAFSGHPSSQYLQSTFQQQPIFQSKTQHLVQQPLGNRIISLPMSSPRIQAPLNQQQPNFPFDNRYPSPSTVTVSQKIDKSPSDRQISHTRRDVLNQTSLYTLHQPSHTGSRVIDNSQQAYSNFGTTNQIVTKTQPMIITGRSLSPGSQPLIQSNQTISNQNRPMNPFNALLQPFTQVPLTQSFQNENSRNQGSFPTLPHENKSSISGPSSTGVNQRLFQTFNPNSNQRISIYTGQPENKHLSPNHSSRSQSPPSGQHIQSSQTLIIHSSKSNIPAPESSILHPSSAHRQMTSLNQSQVSNMGVNQNLMTRNNSQDNINTHKSVIMMLDQSHKRSSSLQPKQLQMKFSRFKTEANGLYIDNNEQTSNENTVSRKSINYLQRPTSTLAEFVNQEDKNQYRRITSSKPGSPQVTTFQNAYGLTAPNPIKFNQISSTSKQPMQTLQQPSKYSSKPITLQKTIGLTRNGTTGYQNSNLNTTATREYYSANPISTKQQQQQQVFNSKYKVIEGLSEDNSSGIEVQQRYNNQDCCRDC